MYILYNLPKIVNKSSTNHNAPNKVSSLLFFIYTSGKMAAVAPVKAVIDTVVCIII